MTNKEPAKRPNSAKCLEVIKQAKVMLKSKMDSDYSGSFSDTTLLVFKVILYFY